MEVSPGDVAAATSGELVFEQQVAVESAEHRILCCECGLPTAPNPANMCIGCIRLKVDIADTIPKTSLLYQCKFCERYLQPPNTFVPAALESKELLALCLRKLKPTLTKVRLIDAKFVWTEPHSKRLKIRLTIQKEVMGGAVLQQSFVVEFTVYSQMCDECRRAEAKDYWRACVQVRQRCDHKKTMFYLEQVILKHGAYINTTGIKPEAFGIDFFYAKLQDSRKLVDFLVNFLPCKYGYAKELVTHDAKNNTFDYKHTFCVEIVPICKDNVVCLPPKLAQSLGNIGQLCVCLSVSNVVHLIEPQTGQMANVSSNLYWRHPFDSLCQPKQLTEYTVIDSEEVDTSAVGHRVGAGQISSRHVIADVWLMRTAELGHSDAQQICTRTHLGHLLSAGDTVLGLDIASLNANNQLFETLQSKVDLPDVVIVKKVYDRTLRRRRRNWRLKRIAKELDAASSTADNDFAEFMDDLEEDNIVRQNVNIYKKTPVEKVDDDGACVVTDGDGDGLPHISLQEMLDDLQIDDQEMHSDIDNAEDQ